MCMIASILNIVLSLLNLPFNLLDVKYTINVVDLIFDNCYIIDRSNDWSLLLFKEAYHIIGSPIQCVVRQVKFSCQPYVYYICKTIRYRSLLISI